MDQVTGTMTRCHRAAVFAVAGCALFVGGAAAQQRTVRVRVVDVSSVPVPHAVVVVNSGAPRTADDSGRLELRVGREQTMRIWVRRIGFRENVVEVRTNEAEGEIAIRLTPVVQQLSSVTISERASTPLARTGFYDRMRRVADGAIVAEFVTPEELESRTLSKASDLFHGRRTARVRATATGKLLILGRGDCPMTILVDKQRVNRSAQDLAWATSAQALPGLDGRPRPREGAAVANRNERPEEVERSLPSLDELVGANEIMAVEIYSSMANAPAELVQLTGGGSCGLVAIWTGARH